ncbi:GAF and ANTAR domain-containing protein [Streptomyces sp. NPDC003697]
MRPRDDGFGAQGEDPSRRDRGDDGLQDRDATREGAPVDDPVTDVVDDSAGPVDDPAAHPGDEPTEPAAGPAAVRGDLVDVIAGGVRGVPPEEVPRRLCALAVKLLPVVGASVSLRADGMPVQLSASDDAAARMGAVQATLGDGPCLYAAELGAPVLASDLSNGGDARRWPVFAQQAAELGVAAVYSLPLGNDAVCVGTLDLYSDVPRELGRQELDTAQHVAGVMTLALMSLLRGDTDDAQGQRSWLNGLATDQDEVYQAIGMIMAQLGAAADEALARLRARAFVEGRTALDVAREVIRHRKRFDRD